MTEVADLLSKYYAKGIVIDTNILLLYLVGSVNHQRITKFKRTAQFIPEDYDRALEVSQYFFLLKNLEQGSIQLRMGNETHFKTKRINTVLMVLRLIYLPTLRRISNHCCKIIAAA